MNHLLLHWSCSLALELHSCTGAAVLHWSCGLALELQSCTGAALLHWSCSLLDLHVALLLY